MKTRYLIYNHDNFDDIGLELFKLGVALSYADKTKRTLVFNNNDYIKIIDTFIKCDYKNIKLDYTTISKFNYEIDYDIENLYINLDESYYNFKYISPKNRVLLTLLITNNSTYINYIYNKLNDFMNYFKEYDINNYVCMNIKKETYNCYYYEKAYYRHFNNKKIIVRVDDIEWAKENINFIDISNIIFIEENPLNKFTDFILFTFFKNYIIDDDYFSLWISYFSNINKKIIVPNNNPIYLEEWYKQF